MGIACDLPFREHACPECEPKEGLDEEPKSP